MGAPCFRAGFCSKTIIPDSEEHPLASSRAVPKDVLRWIRAKESIIVDKIELDRFKLEGFLGSGSDYEVHAATDSDTAKQVVIKRPNPDYITRGMHHGIDQLSEQLVQIHETVGASSPYVAHLVGYTELAQHNGYFGDSLKEEYRVLVEERAKGLPLISDIRDKFLGIPIGLPQNLFALYPLVPVSEERAFTIHEQIMDVEEAFHHVGHLLLDMRPQNVYFDPKKRRIKVIDIGTIPTQGPAAQGKVSGGNQPRDIHDFYAEIFKFYATPNGPPSNVAGYGEPVGMRSIPHFDQQLDSLIRSFSVIENPLLKEAALGVLERIQSRGYASLGEFRKEFGQYLAVVADRNRNLPDLPGLTNVWVQAMENLSDKYWRKFLFDPDSDLVAFRVA